MKVPAVFAWALFFAPGSIFITASIVRLQIDGLTLLGAAFLIIFLWLIGAFTAEFWAAEVPPTREHEKVDALTWGMGPELSRLDRLDGVGNPNRTRKANQ